MASLEITERRKNLRYKAHKDAYAAISPNSHKLGRITDISMGGLSFKYIDTSDGYASKHLHLNESIFLSSVEQYLGDLSFKTVSDYELSDSFSFSALKMRKRHVQFIDLNSKQLFDLDNYIRNNTLNDPGNILSPITKNNRRPSKLQHS